MNQENQSETPTKNLRSPLPSILISKDGSPMARSMELRSFDPSNILLI